MGEEDARPQGRRTEEMEHMMRPGSDETGGEKNVERKKVGPCHGIEGGRHLHGSQSGRRLRSASEVKGRLRMAYSERRRGRSHCLCYERERWRGRGCAAWPLVSDHGGWRRARACKWGQCGKHAAVGRSGVRMEIGAKEGYREEKKKMEVELRLRCCRLLGQVCWSQLPRAVVRPGAQI